MWFILALLSAFCLGFYDVFRKFSMKGNAVVPVLLCSVSTSAIILLPILVLSRYGVIAEDAMIYVPPIDARMHLYLILKAAIVLGSWCCVYNGLKTLPLSIVSPIRATSPVWTIIGALIIYSERPNVTQWIGLIVTLTFFFFFSVAGKREGINFRANKAVWSVILGTLIGSCSALFDKFLINTACIPRMSILCYYSFYQVLILIPMLFVIWYPTRKETPFIWKWTIPCIGAIIIISDFVYYGALGCDGAMISLISPLRRSNAIVAFLMAYFLFHERNMKRKGLCLLGILTGIAIIIWGSV